MRLIGLAAAVLSVTALGAPSASQPAAPARGEAIFVERCKDCHEPAIDRAPSRQELAAKTRGEVIAAMTTGPMTPMAEGLTPAEKQAVAAYITAH